VELARETVAEAPQDAIEQLRDLRKMTTRTIDSVRQFSRDLRPTVLEDLGLVAALQYLVNELDRQDTIEASLDVVGTAEGMSPDMEVTIYRIVQEALTNIRKHARASHAKVKAQFLARQVVVTIQDNGTGFPVADEPADLASTGSFGLMGLQERAQLFGGEMTISSQSGHGTTLQVVLPRDLRPTDLVAMGSTDITP